ncbi:hypothetical protein QQS21_002567 [Conoideocrella luteorostrata]|uniref:Uncharacterized protein n=1 Tax=Conoideocrella luteorostrata TaxID=1105319 RepID=A0AAJ0G171_9HYPO|nr:hypothetical protein QQS21_002567 [Conoideocrella luteorostrata]
MRVSQTLTLSALVLATGTVADGFWLAKNTLSGIGTRGIGGGVKPGAGWMYIFVDDVQNCDQISHAGLINGYSDVSKHRGIRIKWKDQGDKIEKLVPLEVEWNTDKAHATWYANRDGAVVDTKGKKLFTCKADTTKQKRCSLPAAGHAEVISIIHCDGPKPPQ